MAQKEYFNYMNFGGDDYFDPCNKNNYYYDDNDYKLNRYKARDSILVREVDEKGKIIDIGIDIGLSHHQHGMSHDLSNDRLWLNKIDNPQRYLNDIYDVNYNPPHNNYTNKDFQERIYRVSKLVDRDVFHEQLGFINPPLRRGLYWHNTYWYFHHRYHRKRGE